MAMEHENTVYVVYEYQTPYTYCIGVFESLEKARAAIQREMKRYDNFGFEKLTVDDVLYPADKDGAYRYKIQQTAINKRLMEKVF